MATAGQADTNEAAIWARVINPDGDLSPATARAILQLSFPDRDRQRMRELSAKARAGTLTDTEEFEMDNFERVGQVLSILKSKARKVLKQTRRSG
jgi:hypothetical protein